MSFRLRGKNFQAWKEFDLEASGLTVLIGPSNEGKSSIFRALKGLVRNQLGAHFVRTGSDAMEVELQIDGHTILARRTKKGSVKYIVDGEEFNKVGKDVPEPVKALLMGEIEIGDVSLDPVFATQGDTQFLLQESPLVLNTVLGAFSSTEKLEHGKREGNSRVTGLNREASTLAFDLRGVEARKAVLADLVNRADRIQAQVDSLTSVIARQEAVVAELNHLIECRTRLNNLKSVINRVTVPSTAGVEQSLQTLVWVTQLVQAKKRYLRLQSVVSKLTVPLAKEVLIEAKIVGYIHILATAKKKLTLNRAWFTAIGFVITTWYTIVTDYRKLKAVGEAHAQMVAHKTYSARANLYAEKLATMVKALQTILGQTLLRSQRVETLAELESRFMYHRKLLAEQIIVQTKLDDLRTKEKALEQRIAEEREREFLAANSLTCPHCGKAFIANQGEEHEHSRTTARPQTSTGGNKGNGRSAREAAA